MNDTEAAPAEDLAAPPASPLTLELSLDPADLPRLARMAGARARGHAAQCGMVWHDTTDSALASAGLAVVETRLGRRTKWRLERMLPEPTRIWPPAAPAPVLAEADSLDALADALPRAMAPAQVFAVAAFDGRLSVLEAGPITLTVLSGLRRAVAGAQPLCRVTLAGPQDAVAALAVALAEPLRLAVPAVSLSADALAMARQAPPPRHVGPPVMPRHLPVGDAFAYLVVHLTDVLLHFAPEVGHGAEPVHQMRVALRRLRSAAALFRHAVQGPELAAANEALRALNRVLGPARDWDVFNEGSAREVAEAFAGDKAVQNLAAGARRRRDAAYAALRAELDGPGFRRLGINLSVLATTRPWDGAAEPGGPDAAEPERRAETLDESLSHFAGRALHRRMHRLMAPGPDIAGLPAADLHAIRLQAKRLRYASEFFAPLFPGRETRRFIRRLAVLQDQLGHLNDTRVAADLLAELGAERGFAAGVVRGWVAAGAAGARSRAGRAWHRLRKLEPFWS
jgi:triphosphatase